jgi:hypothetical protein
MDIKLSIDVTDRALEFSRNMRSLFVNLGVIDKESMERSANRPVQKALDEHAEKVSHEPPVDAPWNTDPIEPDPIKADQAETSAETNESDTKKPEYPFEDVRKACADFQRAHGKDELKALFDQFGAKKLQQVPEERMDELWWALHA